MEAPKTDKEWEIAAYAMRLALKDTSAALRSLYPEIFRKVDKIQRTPGWFPNTFAGTIATSEAVDAYEMRSCTECGEEFAVRKKNKQQYCRVYCKNLAHRKQRESRR